MRMNISLRSLKSRVTLLAAVVLMASCGNEWMASRDREQTPSALLKKAIKADDKGDYETSIKIYRDILEKDPANDDVRIRLTYALNGKAGLGFFDLIDKVASNKTESSTATSTGTGTSTSSAAAGLGVIAKVVGLGATEKASIVSAFTTNSNIAMKDLRPSSDLLTILHESWLAICRILPSESLAANIAKEAAVMAAAEGEKCKGGLPAAQVKGSAKFAAALQLVAEGMILYQTVIDADGDGQLDLLKKADAINSSISTIQGQVAAATGSQVTTLLTDLNKSMAELKALGDAFKGEAVSLTLADFSLVADLVATIDGLPDDVKTNIRSTVDKFTEAKNKMNEFSNAGKQKSSTGTSSSAENDPVKATEKAAQTFNDLNDKIATLPAGEQTKAKAEMAEACTNFDSVKLIYHLPSDTKRPDGCSGTALTLNLHEEGNSGSFSLHSDDGAPAISGPAAETLDGDSVSSDLVDFARFGQSIIPFGR